MTIFQARKPAGAPNGGQFTASDRPESETELVAFPHEYDPEAAFAWAMEEEFTEEDLRRAGYYD